ncbi:unnamed protein product [Strongylus vulgaris]|uniref:Uncharacterized protein n=1 Tax=Strongylus vulgaris TaxID=40348 RepID=A0A3P7JK88_STRVU|nr:unnamed protein product [Strongylus vulgaris]
MTEAPGKRKSAAVSLYDDEDEETPPAKKAAGAIGYYPDTFQSKYYVSMEYAYQLIVAIIYQLVVIVPLLVIAEGYSKEKKTEASPPVDASAKENAGDHISNGEPQKEVSERVTTTGG